MGTGTRKRAVRVRRSPHLIAEWRGDTLVARNFATGVAIEVPPGADDILRNCHDWTTLGDLESAGVVPSSQLSAIVARLVELTLLERSAVPRDARAIAMDTLSAWNPQAGYFHSTTKNLRFVSPAVLARRGLTNDTRPPAAIKRYPNRSTIDLKRPDANGELATALRSAPHLASLLTEAHHD